MADSIINNLAVRKKTITVTTNNMGLISLSLSLNDSVPVAVRTGTKICVISPYTWSTYWYAKVQLDDGTIVANEELTVDVFWLPFK